MATITLEYDAKNQIAEKIMSVIFAMDNLFKVVSRNPGKTATRKKTGLELALEDVRKGRVYTAYVPKNKKTA